MYNMNAEAGRYYGLIRDNSLAIKTALLFEDDYYVPICGKFGNGHCFKTPDHTDACVLQELAAIHIYTVEAQSAPSEEKKMPPLDVLEYVRKPFVVQAIRVSEENMTNVANWCEGVIRPRTGAEATYIMVDVRSPLTERQTKAFVGDWVLSAGTGFKVYTNGAFEKNFVITEEPRYY